MRCAAHRAERIKVRANVFLIVKSKGLGPLDGGGEISVGIEGAFDRFLEAATGGELHSVRIGSVHQRDNDLPPSWFRLPHNRGEHLETALRADENPDLLRSECTLKAEFALRRLVGDAKPAAENHRRVLVQLLDCVDHAPISFPNLGKSFPTPVFSPFAKSDGAR